MSDPVTIKDAGAAPSSGEPERGFGGDALIGTRLNNIELVRPLDAGGMGTIYLGVNRELDKQYAVKVASEAADPAFEGRALLEAKALSKLDHPNIVQVFDAWTLPDGRLAIVMPLLSGRSLAHLIDRRPDGAGKRMPVRAAVLFALQLARGLDEAHRNGFVHRDMKPGNVFVTQRETELEGFRVPEVKLLDFGLVRVAQSSWEPLNPDQAQAADAPARTIAGGTPEYVSPEQATGSPTIDGRADLYSLGVMLFELLAGRLPFLPEPGGSPRDQVVSLLVQHHRTPAPRLAAFAPEVPRALDELVAQLLAKSPAQRPQSAKVVEDRLREIARALPREDAPARPAGRRRLALWAAPVALAAAAAVAWLGRAQPREAPPPASIPSPAGSTTPVATTPAPPPAPPTRPEPAAPLPAAEPPPALPAAPLIAEPSPPPREEPQPLRAAAKKKPARKPGPGRAAGAPCTPDARWRQTMSLNLKELGQLAQDDAEKFRAFRRAEQRLSPLVREASTEEDCARANALFEELSAAVQKR